MAIAMLEPLMDELNTQLQARLPAILATLAAGPPALTLPAVAEWNLGDVDFGEKWPIVTILAVESPATHEKAGRINFEHRCEIRCSVVSDTPTTLERLMHRYATAIVQALLNAETAGSFTFQLDLNGLSITYGDQIRNTNNALQRDVRIPLKCWKAEEA